MNGQRGWEWCALWLLVLPAALVGACNTGGPAVHGSQSSRTASDLPVSRVVLYRSGIAYMERQGRVDGNELRLQIEPTQINDILTSLTVIVDRGANLAASIGLPIEQTMAQDLEGLPPQVQQEGGMLSLLQAFRGAQVRLRTASGSAEGRVVGTEALVNDDGNLIRRVTLMTDAGELLQFRVDEVLEARLLNSSLEVGLSKALDVSLGEGDWKPVELLLHLTGDGPHDVFISYVVAMPTWKPTYRLLMDGDSVHLQGWADVDNVSGEDWQDVRLSLVAGTPISFTYDLHTPRFVTRPDLTARGFADETNLTAPDIDRGVRAQSTPTAAAMPPAAPGRARAATHAEAASGGAPAEQPQEGYWNAPSDTSTQAAQGNIEMESQMLVNSMSQSAAGSQVDALFRYDIGDPVTVSDRSSALVSIINEAVTGEDVLYFDPSSGSPQAAGTPYRAVRLQNTTQYTVERGPLTLFKDNTFVGQALTPRIAAGEMVFVPYSLDGRFHLTQVQSTGEEGVRLVRIVNSVIYSEVQQVDRRTYQITNNSGEAARLYIRVPKQTNWNLRTPDPETAGVLDQGDVWYVPVELDTSPSRQFVIEQATTVTRSVEIWSDLAADTIGLYISDPDADPQIASTLQTVLDERNRIAEIDQELQRARSQRDDVYQRMSEVRQNLDALGDSRQARQLRTELEQRLGSLEEDATNDTVQVVSLGDEQSQLRARISTALMDLSLEPSSGTGQGADEGSGQAPAPTSP